MYGKDKFKGKIELRGIYAVQLLLLHTITARSYNTVYVTATKATAFEVTYNFIFSFYK